MTGWRMRPTASALGVIAIVSVMITATPSEAENGIEHSITHPETGEEAQRVQEDERTANGTISVDPTAIIQIRRNDTVSEPTTPRNPVPTGTDANSELQRDQSDTQLAPEAPVDVQETGHGPEGSEQRIPERNSNLGKLQDTSRVFSASTVSNRFTTDSWQGQVASRSSNELDDVQVDDEGLSNVVEDETDDSGMEKHGGESIGSTIGSIVTETRSMEQKNVEDIRAISFQVPPPDDESPENRKQQEGDEEARKPKDHSRPVNNLLPGGGKSTKAFYEIKPSIKTEMENGQDQQLSASTQRTLAGRKFVLPSVDSAFGKFGPYFEDGDREMNITARIGSTMLLDCKIGMLGDKKVTWLQQHSNDSFRLLTVDRTTYSVDQRISLNFRYPGNWRLQIRFATPRDSGLYKCQVATHPPLVKKINVVVTAPELTITDDSGRIVPKERHLKAGSALKLKCEARDVLESLKESVIWTRGDETLTDDVSENRTTEISAGKEVLVIVSTLIVDRASPRHAGNYSCMVPGKAKTTIAVHVLNGELPAAVHDGNGVSRAFLNLWLIHLTMSYVFSR